MYRRRNSNEIYEEGIMSDPGIVPDRTAGTSAAISSGGVKKKRKQFRKSTSTEPANTENINVSAQQHQRKKSFTTFWNQLFSHKGSENSNRLSGISIESSSFESVNTILSTNSFTFVSPSKKGKQKGKRIPVQEETIARVGGGAGGVKDLHRKKVGTLTRIGMKIGLKSKYNLQSCESLHQLSYLETTPVVNVGVGGAGSNNFGTLSNTYRKKRRAPPPPEELERAEEQQNPGHSKSIQQPQTQAEQQQSTEKASEQHQAETNSEPKSPKAQQKSPEKSSEASSIPGPSSSSPSSPKPSTSREFPSQNSSPIPGPSKVAKQRSDFDPKTFQIKAKHRRSSSDGPALTPSSVTSMSPSTSQTLSGTYRKCHVRGKRKAPAPPNPFGDPDAPETEEQENQNNQRHTPPNPFEEDEDEEPVPAEPKNPALNSPLQSGSSSTEQQNNINTEVIVPSTNNLPPAIQIEDEIFQNNLNEQLSQEQEQLELQHQQQLQPTADAQPGPSRLSQAPTEQERAAVERELQVLMNVTTTTGAQKNDNFDPRVRQELLELKREADKSPLLFLRKSKTERNSEFRNSAPPVSPSVSPVPAAEAKKLTPKPWYKRSSSSGGQSKKSKHLLQPLPGMTKFSDIDREANRIIEEQKRRSAEQGFHESARELISMFNNFNQTSRSTTSTSAEASENSVNSVADRQSTTTSASATNHALTSSTSVNTTSSTPSSQSDSVALETRAAITTKASTSISSVTTASVTSATKTTTTGATTATSSTSTQPTIATTAASGATKPTTATKTTSSTQPTPSTSTSAVVRHTHEAPEEPKKLAIVRPQSSPQSKTTTAATTSSTTATSTTTSRLTSNGSTTTTTTFCKYPVQRKEDWICSRCTLKNAAWRLTCEACYNRPDSSIHKISSVFENPLSIAATRSSFIQPLPTTAQASPTTAITSATSTTTTATTSTTSAAAAPAPQCQNFIPSTSNPAAPPAETQEGIKLDGSAESLDISQLRQQRLSFFGKRSSGTSTESAPDAAHEPSTTETPKKSENGSAANARAPENPETEAKRAEETASRQQTQSGVFSDDEDDSIDALIGLQRTTVTAQHPISTSTEPAADQPDNLNIPTFGPRNWNPFQMHRFRPMLEAIVEQSQDMYARIDAPYYENWEFGPQGPPHPVEHSNVNGLMNGNSNRTRTNTFMPTTCPEGNAVYSNSDSSSCSECEGAAAVAMDGRDEGHRRHSHHHHHHNPRHFYGFYPSSGEANNLPQDYKLTLADYQKLGGLPNHLFENVEERHQSGSRGRHQHSRRHSSALDEPRSSASVGVPKNGPEGRANVEVEKLLRRLEWAIAEGDHRLAATLAHDLALLKVSCVVAKEDDMTKPIIIRVYVEDRFMQQGPFQVQVTKIMTVKDLKQKIESDWSIPTAFQKWILGRKMAESDDQKLLDFEIANDDMAFLYLVTPQIEPEPPVPPKPASSKAAATLPGPSSAPATQLKQAAMTTPRSPALPAKATQSTASVSAQETYMNVPNTKQTVPAQSNQQSQATITKKVSAGVQATVPATSVASTEAPKLPPKATESPKNVTVQAAPDTKLVAAAPTASGAVMKFNNFTQATRSVTRGNETPMTEARNVTAVQNSPSGVEKSKEPKANAGQRGNHIQQQAITQPPQSVKSESAAPQPPVKQPEVKQSDPASAAGPALYSNTPSPRPARALVSQGAVTVNSKSTSTTNLVSATKQTAAKITSTAQTHDKQVPAKPAVALSSSSEQSQQPKPAATAGNTVAPTNFNSSPKPFNASNPSAVPAKAPSTAMGLPKTTTTNPAAGTKVTIGQASTAAGNTTANDKLQRPSKAVGVSSQAPASLRTPEVAVTTASKASISTETASSSGSLTQEPVVPMRRTKKKNVDGSSRNSITPEPSSSDEARTPRRHSSPIPPVSTTASAQAFASSTSPSAFNVTQTVSAASVVKKPTNEVKPTPALTQTGSPETVRATETGATKASQPAQARADTATVSSKPLQTNQAAASVFSSKPAQTITAAANALTQPIKANQASAGTSAKPVQPNPPIEATSTLPAAVQTNACPAAATPPKPIQNNTPSATTPPRPVQTTKPNAQPEAPAIAASSSAYPLPVKATPVQKVETGVQSTLPRLTKTVNESNKQSPEKATPSSGDSTPNVDIPGKEAKEPVSVSSSTTTPSTVTAVVKPNQGNTSTKTQNSDNNAENYNALVQLLEKSDLIFNSEEFDCPVCFLPVPVNEGVVLRECLHSFCKECLIGSVQYAEEPQVKCPYRDDKYSCNSLILEREIKALVPPEIFERHLAKSVKIAEGKIANTFHCRTADCAGWCVFEDDVNIFLCPVCKKRNCLTCQAIHEGMDCQQYQRQLAIDSETDENAKSSRLMLEKMIQRGEALECPACHVVLLKKWGCDWVRCSYCKTEICWITKGFRWGPNGKGDTSGGCKCGVNGVRCHPKCTYCH